MESSPTRSSPQRQISVLYEQDNRTAYLEKHYLDKKSSFSSEYKKTKMGRINMWWSSYSIEFRELVVYLLFLVVYSIICFGPSGTAIDRYQLKNDLSSNVHPSYSTTVTTKAAWSSFMESTLLPNLYSTELGDDDGPDMFAADGVNLRIGTIRIRLVRVEDDKKNLPDAYAEELEHLYPKLNYESNMETSNYNLTNGYGVIKWKSGSSLGNTFSLYSTSTGFSYPPSGYAIDLPKGLANATSVLTQLKGGDLLDTATRAAFVDYSLYNANTDEFAVVTLMSQFLATGGVDSEVKMRVQPLLAMYRILTGDNAAMIWQLLVFMEMVLYCLVFLLVYREYKAYKALGYKVYSQDSFAILDLLNYTLFIIVMFLRINLVAKLWYLDDALVDDDGTEFINLTSVAGTFSSTESAMAFNAIITFFKVFKYLRPVRRLALFTETLRLASGDMAYMCVVIAVILLAFGTSFNLGFGSELSGYMTLPVAMLSLFRAMLGDFDLDALVEVNYALGPFLFVLFIFLVFFVILSMFLSIVDESYDVVRTALEEQVEAGIVQPLERDLRRFKNEVKHVIFYVIQSLTGLSVTASSKIAPINDNNTQTKKNGDAEQVNTSPLIEASDENAIVEMKQDDSGAGGGGGTAEFGRMRNELAVEATPVAEVLTGAFQQLEDLGSQQNDMLKILRNLESRLVKRKKKLIEENKNLY
jgi:hypothetical protein